MPGEHDHVLLETQGAGRGGAAADEQQDRLGDTGVQGTKQCLRRQGDDIGDEGAVFALNAEFDEPHIGLQVVYAVRY